MVLWGSGPVLSSFQLCEITTTLLKIRKYIENFTKFAFFLKTSLHEEKCSYFWFYCWKWFIFVYISNCILHNFIKICHSKNFGALLSNFWVFIRDFQKFFEKKTKQAALFIFIPLDSYESKLSSKKNCIVLSCLVPE